LTKGGSIRRVWMAVFRYVAKNHHGHQISGTYQAEDLPTVVLMLSAKGYYAIGIYELHGQINWLGLSRIRDRVTHKDLACFCRQFSVIIGAGITVSEGLNMLREQTENARLRNVIGLLHRDVQRGRSLSSAMGRFKAVFPELLKGLVEAGEASGNLDKVLERAAQYYEKEHKTGQAIRNAMIYPAIVAIVSVSALVLFITVVLPAFASMYEQMGVVLPTVTRLVIGAGDMAVYWLLLVLLAIVLVPTLKAYSTYGGRHRIDRLKLRLPFIGEIIGKILNVRFARTLGTLIDSGLPLLDSIKLAERVMGNVAVARRLQRVEDSIRRGKSLSESLAQDGFFKPLLIRMIRVGQDTGTLGYMLDKAADFFEEDLSNATTRMTALLEPTIILIIGAIMAFVIISVIIPMFDIMTGSGF
jgi:type IV pilus assembly protein PilC